GDAALAIKGNARKYTDPFGGQSWGSLGVIQYVRTTPNRKYSGSAWFYHESGTTQEFNLIWKRSAVHTSTFRQSNRGLFPFGTWIHSTKVTVPSGVWTKAELSAVTDVP